MPKTALKVAGVVFLIVALAHLSRLVFKFQVIIGTTPIPLWVNGAAFVIALSLCFWMFKASK